MSEIELVTAKAAIDPLLFTRSWGRAVERRLSRELIDILQPAHALEIEHRWTAETVEQVDGQGVLIDLPWAIDLDVPENARHLVCRASTRYNVEV